MLPRLRTFGLLGLLSALAVAAPSLVAPQQAAMRFEGEYGLFVRVVENGLEAHWVTEERSRGRIEAVVDGEVVARRRTGRGQAHRALVKSTAPVVELRYGADGDRAKLHCTTIVREPPGAPKLRIAGVDSVYMIGDVHGEYDRVLALLSNAGLIDPDLRWVGGERHLVLLGDLFDRGPDVTRVLWFLYRLEREAAEAGGAVHVLLGNHELMVMSSDLRYVSGKETMLANLHEVGYGELFDPHESVLGRWLASRPGLVRMEDLLLAHGGVSPEYVDYSIEEFQDTLSSFMDEELFLRWNDTEFLEAFADTTTLDSAGVFRRYDFFFGRRSVMWYRSLVQSDTLEAFLDRVLDRYDASVHVVGHTPVKTIQERYGGKLIAADLTDAATEMLFLARGEDGEWDRMKIPLFGPHVPLGGETVSNP